MRLLYICIFRSVEPAPTLVSDGPNMLPCWYCLLVVVLSNSVPLRIMLMSFEPFRSGGARLGDALVWAQGGASRDVDRPSDLINAHASTRIVHMIIYLATLQL
jgi:hypothetical protein